MEFFAVALLALCAHHAAALPTDYIAKYATSCTSQPTASTPAGTHATNATFGATLAEDLTINITVYDETGTLVTNGIICPGRLNDLQVDLLTASGYLLTISQGNLSYSNTEPENQGCYDRMFSNLAVGRVLSPFIINCNDTGNLTITVTAAAGAGYGLKQRTAVYQIDETCGNCVSNEESSGEESSGGQPEPGTSTPPSPQQSAPPPGAAPPANPPPPSTAPSTAPAPPSPSAASVVQASWLALLGSLAAILLMKP